MKSFKVETETISLARGATASSERVPISWRGRAIAALTQGEYRAYLYPVYTPQGVQATGELPADHPHHNSITVGADHFNCYMPYSTDRTEEATYNLYVNRVFQGRAPGRTWVVSIDSEELSEDHLRIVQRVQWQGPEEWGAADGRRVLAEETRTIDIYPGEVANVIDVRSELRPTEWDITIGPTRHAYFTVRLADGLRVVDGGTLVDSEGRVGGEAVTGQTADWVDMSGPGPHGRKAGIAVVPHPSASDTTWIVYDWGTITINPFLNKRGVLNRGDTLDLGMRILAHDGDAEEAGVAGLYQEFLRERQ